MFVGTLSIETFFQFGFVPPACPCVIWSFVRRTHKQWMRTRKGHSEPHADGKGAAFGDAFLKLKANEQKTVREALKNGYLVVPMEVKGDLDGS